MDNLRQDVRFAFRTLVKAPLASGLAIACLAIGIGANATMFSVFDGVLLKPFPFADPERIVVITETNRRNGIDDGGMSFLTYRDLRDQARTVSAIAVQTGRSLTFMYETEAVRHSGRAVSWNLFDLLGVRPALGRAFRADDDRPGAAGTIILGDAVWRARFNADPGVIGRTIVVNDAPHTIVGVMPPRFAFPHTAEAWIPMEPLHHRDSRGDRVFEAYARLAPDQ